MSLRLMGFIVAALLCGISVESKAQEPLGMVVDVQGAVSASEAGKASRVEMLSYLKPNMDLDLAAGSSLTVTWYASSKEIRFSGPSKLKVTRERIHVVQGGGANERSLGEEKVALGKGGAPGRLAQATIMMRSMKPPVQDPPSPPLTHADHERLEKLKPAAGAGFSDWLMYALALEELKQTAEARPIWKKLAAERPEEPKLRQYADR
jgi:hypothetical protein